MNFNDNGIFGFDVSLYQDNNETPQQIDFNKMKSYGASFVIIKAGQNDYRDPDFDYNWREARAAGLPRASYWFLDIYATAQEQAQYYWNIVKDDPGEGPLFVDFEKNLSGFIPKWYVVKDFIVELQRLSGFPNSKIGIYTGYYIWTDYGPLLTADKDWFAKYPLWLAWYSSTPTYVKVPPTWMKCIIWQDGTPAVGLSAGVESREIDHNKFNGTPEEFYSWFGTPPITTIHTVPFVGGDEYIEIVNGERCHITIVDMHNKKFRVKHFDGGLRYVSRVAVEDNTLLAANGVDYDKNAPVKYFPKGLSYTDGVKYTDQENLEYWMNVGSDNSLTADFRIPINLNFWNATSFIRPLVIDGKIAQDIIDNPIKLEYVEIHAFSGLGFLPDGRIIQIVAEGKVDPNTGIAYRGITIPQLAKLFVDYGAWFAGQHGGGGDSGKAINGVMVTEPSDPTERAVVQVIEVLEEGVNTMNGTAKEKLGNTSKIRNEPSRYGTEVGIVSPYSTIEFTEIVPATIKGTADKTGELWFKLPNNTYVNYKLYSGGLLTEYYTILTMPAPDPVPTEDKIEIYVNGVLKYTITGTLVVS